MVSVQVQRCSVFNEFDSEQQRRMFGISLNKSLHHIDTLYYTVFLNEPDNIIELQENGNLPDNLFRFLAELKEMKANLRSNLGESLEIDGGLEGQLKTFSKYDYCISLNECFDIFILGYLPTVQTPRVVVQLRSRYLVLEGVDDAVTESFKYLRDFLNPYGLFPVKVCENRIDYAFHTNLIQNPYKFFCDENLKKHLKTNLRIYQKIGNIGEDISVDTFNLGNRRSNNVFFRAYNKAREVIEMNYKSFFIERWRQNGLISEFDEFVYSRAFELGSYRTGCLVGRLEWYVENGTDEELLNECLQLIESCYVKSDNAEQIERRIHNVIPEPTQIFNIEFQCKRKFFLTCESWLNLNELANGKILSDVDPILIDLFRIVYNSKEIINYLTSYGGAVSFAEDRKMRMKDFLTEGEPYMYWWKRIRSTPVEYSSESVCDLYRKYDLHADIQKSRRLLQGQIARVAMLKRSDIKVKSFEEDIADALCVINDNDIVPYIKSPIFADKRIQPYGYWDISYRKSRQLRGIIKNEDENKTDGGITAEKED